MTKTYIEPTLTVRGSVADITRNTREQGEGDTVDGWMFAFVPAGAVGFLL